MEARDSTDLGNCSGLARVTNQAHENKSVSGMHIMSLKSKYCETNFRISAVSQRFILDLDSGCQHQTHSERPICLKFSKTNVEAMLSR